MSAQQDKLVMEKTGQMLDEDKVTVWCIFSLLILILSGWFHHCWRSEGILHHIPEEATDEDISKIINDGDENGDNKIDVSEFVNIMNKT